MWAKQLKSAFAASSLINRPHISALNPEWCGSFIPAVMERRVCAAVAWLQWEPRGSACFYFSSASFLKIPAYNHQLEKGCVVIKCVQSKYTLFKMLINEDSYPQFFIPSRFPLRSRVKHLIWWQMMWKPRQQRSEVMMLLHAGGNVMSSNVSEQLYNLIVYCWFLECHRSD